MMKDFTQLLGEQKMNIKKILFYLLAGILGGCSPVMSLHPLHTDKDVVFEKKLLGTWTGEPNDPNSAWNFSRPDESKKSCNLLTSDEDGNKGSFEVNLLKLNNRLFLDVYPDKLPCEGQDEDEMAWPFNTLFLMPVHTFVMVDSIEPKLTIRLTDNDELKKLLKEDPNAVSHEIVDGKPVLTASTKQLQAFVLKYADDDRLFTNPITLERKKITDPNDAKPAKKAAKPETKSE
jgi:hypothetical protein